MQTGPDSNKPVSYFPIEGRSKTALVLAGGGLTGAVYEIGALRAIDELLVERSVRDFDIIVGTSAGALVGSMLAKGISPGEMMQTLDGSHPEFSSILPKHVFSLNTGEFVRKGLRLPSTLKNAMFHYLRHRNDMNVLDVVWSLIEALPSGLYNNQGLEAFLLEVFQERHLSDSFKDTKQDLFIIATDLDTGKRVVFGRERWRDVPLSRAVAASSAVPLLYKPVHIDDHEFVDGAVRGNASLDVAIEAGAKLIICINPLVPIDNSEKQNIPLLGPDGRFLSEKGAQAVFSQFMRISLRSGLVYHIKQLRRRYPDVDIVLIEPRRDDFQMAFYNTMRYSARVIIAQHGFESVTVDLANQYQELKATLARHGFNITRRFVIEELLAIQESNNDIDVVREMLERSDRRRRPIPFEDRYVTESLQDTLSGLEQVVNRLEQDTSSANGNGASKVAEPVH